MKKSCFIWVLCAVLFFQLLYSCDPINDGNSEKTCWKYVKSEFYGVKPQTNATYESFASFPFNISYLMDGVSYVYTGQEFDVTRTFTNQTTKQTGYLNFTWSEPPKIIYPDQNFTITYESKGNDNNGIGVSIPVYYGSGYQWNTGSYRNGPITATMKISKPDTDPAHQKIKIAVEMSSGRFFYMGWVYVYEWVP